MGGCSAANCSNNSRKGFSLFRFPSDKDRRKKWAANCGRNDWEPTPQARICVAHFEESQFELHRADRKKKLKPNAIPTIFDLPKPSPALSDRRKKGTGCPKPNSLLEKIKHKEKTNETPTFENSEMEGSNKTAMTSLEQSAARIGILQKCLGNPSSSTKTSIDNCKEKAHVDKTYVILKEIVQKDECAIYGEHVGNEIRKLQPRAQTYVKHFINDILFKTAVSEYNVPSSRSTSCSSDEIVPTDFLSIQHSPTPSSPVSSCSASNQNSDCFGSEHDTAT